MLDELEIPFPPSGHLKSVEDIDRGSVIACVNYLRSLDVSYHVPSDNHRNGLATWVPDWSDVGWKESDLSYGLLRCRFAAFGSADSR